MRTATFRAKQLRANQTVAEKRLWRALRGRQLHGYRFTRQYPIDEYVVDFCCREERLIIEVDGGQHDINRDYDEDRTKHLESRGYTVLRFWNTEVLGNLDGALEAVASHLEFRRQQDRPSL